MTLISEGGSLEWGRYAPLSKWGGFIRGIVSSPHISWAFMCLPLQVVGSKLLKIISLSE